MHPLKKQSSQRPEKMFTGIVEEFGTIRTIKRLGQGLSLKVECRAVLADLSVGDSICVNGVCLTVVSHNEHSFIADVVAETLSRSTLHHLRVGDLVNLERPLRPSDRLGGHFVQGHVDGIGRVVSREERPPGLWLTIEIPSELVRYLVEKGSVAIDGVSLTIASFNNNIISIAIIPHTAAVTTLGFRAPGDQVNIETDLIGKYVERLSVPLSSTSNFTIERLQEMGF